ncbi:RNA polymerase sigma factor [Spirosoma utsteinense]|uniref:RNA polymerase sigma factor (Sigma-70 family) n=1 Tax=Spirosoma utsteinense TaxID=2585773 RepID=A0ABR6W950_9BACT|nr:sigma-70 family RNA polymerase sigma factor [Spirosoma utsteinense]MBC3787348.1 RNA polymerase sigma factor (sigma-70 family) [Spirosoma utsteinense]MBC3793098.1 RNA polymerase sigma factor (sigma-70 family) [Spirosoma utsteinense]
MQHQNLRPYPTDQDLYTALRQRDERAYQHLYTETFPSFRYWMLNNSASEMDAEDAFQKGMLSFLLNIETGKYQYQPGTRVTTVIFEYGKRVWLTELKSARLRMHGAMPEVIDVADTADVVEDLERQEVVNTVRKSLGQLKDDCRQLIEWFYVDELSLREIAERLGMKESSARSKRYSCAEKLKAFYQETAHRQGL